MTAKDTSFKIKNTLRIHGELKSVEPPLIMGIINLTPDSFYEGSRTSNKEAVRTAEEMTTAGADILDLGSYSSRPGAQDISIREELERLIPALKAVRKHLPHAVISVDTFRAEVARQALENGASMINDISGGRDPEMFKLISKQNVPYVLMHMKGTPANMTKLTDYDDLIQDIFGYFKEKIDILHELGGSNIILDPGFGFAKNIDQNYRLLQSLEYFKNLHCPILVGISRKSMIYKRLGTGPGEALNGTTVLNTVALLNKADILRVHDVKEASEVRELIKNLEH